MKRLLLGLAGLLCIAEIWIAGLDYTNYQISTGAHGWFPARVAFLLHYLLFGIRRHLPPDVRRSGIRPAPDRWRPSTRLEHCLLGEVRAMVFGACAGHVLLSPR